MTQNVGGWDRALRAGMLITSLAAAFDPRLRRGWRWAAMVAAGSALFTVATRYCPLNQLLGLNTAETDQWGSSRSVTMAVPR